jgi:hypothetical protein
MKRLIVFLIGYIILCGFVPAGRTSGIYRYFWGKKDNYKIWIIDGSRVRQKIYKEFLYGGNEQRYIFNPKGEIWIDNAITCEEFDLTVAHELNERHLMAKFGWTYDKSHDSSLAVEQVIRRENETICHAHEASLKKVGVTDSYGAKEIPSLPDSIRLTDIYRIPEGIRDSISIWVVDGYVIRKNIYPDFGFSGNDLAYHFIPPKEIWIDGQVSCEETEYSIALEMTERKLMREGKTYSDAYEDAVSMVMKMRNEMDNLVKKQPKTVIPEILERDSGIIDPGEK